MSREIPALAGRVELVTGASGGIGGAIAGKLAAEGVDAALASSTSPRWPRSSAAWLGTTDEVAELALTMLRIGYLTNKTYTLDGGLVPA